MSSAEQQRRLRDSYLEGLKVYELEREQRRKAQAPIFWKHGEHSVRLRLTEEWFAATPVHLRDGPFGGVMEEAAEMIATGKLPSREEGRIADMTGSFHAKTEMQNWYAWAIPTPRALEVLAFHAPIVELGAGTGYWASLLREAGLDVVAYDLDPPSIDSDANHWHKYARTYTEVEKGGVDKVSLHGDRTLFLSWPLYDAPVGAMAVQNHLEAGGGAVVFIGEGPGGCTGDDHLFELFDAFYDEITNVTIPQWWGLHDYMTVFHRNDRPLRELPSSLCHICGRRTYDPYYLRRGECRWSFQHPDTDLGGFPVRSRPLKTLPRGST